MKNFVLNPRFYWAAALLALPVTSFRWFPLLGETTYVRPLALYPLAILIPLLLMEHGRGKKLGFSAALIPLGAFLLFALTATAFGWILNPPPLRGQAYFGRALRALATLAVGLSFFLAAMWMNKDEEDLRFTARWILAGLCLDLAWSALQAAAFYTSLIPKVTVTHWQLAFSMRELTRSNRVSGLAYEPAWLAGQFATLFFPWLFAAVLTNYRVSKFKWLEPALLILSLPVLLATYSRGGLLTSAAAAGLTFALFGREILSAAREWLARRRFRAPLGDAILRAGLILLVVGIFAGGLGFLSQKEYFSRLWQIDAESFSEYLVDIKAGARGAYNAAAFATFEQSPLFGVGLGGSGFYIYANLPDWALTTVPEIAKQLSPENRLYPNPKNLYARLLAETGVGGFVLFAAFQLYVLGETLSLLRRKENWARYAAAVGIFAWFAIAFYNFTQDSLATPNLWLAFGAALGLSATSPLKETS